MLFNSYAFFVFLPIVWMIYFLMNRLGSHRLALLSLLVGSFVFYGFDDPRLCLLLGASIVGNYCVHLVLTMETLSPTARKCMLVLGLAFDFSLLFYFKYLNFTLTNINRLFSTSLTWKKIALPLGISFYTFQQVSFVIDSYERKMPRYPFLEYSVFVSFFPQLVAGPIVLHQELIPQLRDRSKHHVNFSNVFRGLEYFILGLAKKVLVADSFAKVCDIGFSDTIVLNTPGAFLTMLTYTLEIYFDFSGYCDMAIGLGLFFNIDLPKNFNSPYKSLNISEFWKRWHMTLTRFLTTYVYIPLGGNRKGQLRTLVNIMIVFTVSGIWHGAAWTFLLWGILHGLAQVFHRLFHTITEKLPKWIRWLLTFSFVNVAWIFFRAEYFRQPFRLIGSILKGGMGWLPSKMTHALWDSSLSVLLMERFLPTSAIEMVLEFMTWGWTLFWTVICVKAPSTAEITERHYRSNKWLAWLSLLLILSLFSFSRISKFIYFNF